jgi:hypothetical protein
LDDLTEFGLSVSTFGNSLSSSILGDGVCMSTGWKSNTSS